jgi:prepilin peptidase CpaA
MVFVFPPVIEIGLCGLVLTAAGYDLRSRRIPNWLVGAGLVFGVGLNSFLYEAAGLRLALLGLGLALAIYIPIYALHAIGAGDVKLMAAVGSIVGPAYWIRLFIFTAAAGVLAAVGLIVSRGRMRRTIHNLGVLMRTLASFRLPHRVAAADLDVSSPAALTMPHAVTIALGCILFLVVATTAVSR